MGLDGEATENALITSISDALKEISGRSADLARELRSLRQTNSDEDIDSLLRVGYTVFRSLADDFSTWVFIALRNPTIPPSYIAEVNTKVNYAAALLGGTLPNPATLRNDLRQLLHQGLETMRYIDRFTDSSPESGNQPFPHGGIDGIIERFEMQLHTLDETENKKRSEDALAEIETVVDRVKEAAGVVADIKLGTHYQEIAKSEQSSANWFRAAAIICFVLGIVVAGLVALSIINDRQEGIASQLFKLAVSLPILAVAFYLAHEANSHRMVARRAREVEVRLQTMEAFLAPLEPEQRTQLRAKVGESILSGPLSLSTGTDKQALDAQAIIEKLIDKA